MNLPVRGRHQKRKTNPAVGLQFRRRRAVMPCALPPAGTSCRVRRQEHPRNGIAQPPSPPAELTRVSYRISLAAPFPSHKEPHGPDRHPSRVLGQETGCREQPRKIGNEKGLRPLCLQGPARPRSKRRPVPPGREIRRRSTGAAPRRWRRKGNGTHAGERPAAAALLGAALCQGTQGSPSKSD